MSVIRRARAFKAKASGSVSLKTFDGRDHFVVPVVALVEGVIHASNADSPELVLAEEFSQAPQGWDGRPVMFDHPEINGEKTSANQPKVLERTQIGIVFNTRISGKKLLMEAWLDQKRVEKVGADALLAGIKEGQTTEVSVGVFVAANNESGNFEGRPYKSVWRGIVPDHLAMLPEGVEGACSVEMGCGAPRAAAGGGMAKGKWNEAKRLALRQFIAAAEDGTSDSELRRALEQSLFSSEAGFLGVVDVFQDLSQVVYAVAPEGDTKFFRRGFAFADGAVTLDGKPEEVKQVTKYEAAAGAVGACGCSKPAAPPKEEAMAEVPKEKKARALALITRLAVQQPKLFKAEDAPLFEAYPDERLKVLEAAADEEDERRKEAEKTPPAPVVPPTPPAGTPVPPVKEELRQTAPAKPLTEEEYLAIAPESVKAIVSEHKAAKAARREALVTKLKAACAASYTEEELKALPLEQLEKLEKLVGASSAADFTPLMPRVASEAETVVPAAPNMRERITAARSAKSN